MSTAYLPAQRISLPGKASFSGIDLTTRGDIKIAPIRTTQKFKLASGRERGLGTDAGFTVTVPFVGTLSTLMPLYTRWAKQRYGQAISPRPLAITALNGTTDAFTAVAHGLVNGDTVQVHWDYAAPASTPTLTRTEIYTVAALDADTFTLTTTTTPTLVDVTGAGAVAVVGGLWVRKQDALTVNLSDSSQLVFDNVVPVELPSLVLNGGAFQWEGSIKFRAYPKRGAARSDGLDAFYTRTSVTYTEPTWAGTEDLTVSDMAAALTGASGTLASFRSERGIQVDFRPQITEESDGVFASAYGRLTGFGVSARVKPLGMTLSEFITAFPFIYGAQNSGANLTLTGTGITLVMYDCQTEDGGITASPDESLVDEFSFAAMGNTTSEGKPPFLMS